MRYNHLPPIYFLHIPRTAGTSVRLWLDALFDHDDWLEAHDYNDVWRMDDADLFEYDFYSGHFGYEFVDRIRDLRPDVAVVSWLRDPVERQLSAWRYAADQQRLNTDPLVVLKSPGYSTHGANYQIRYLTRIWRVRAEDSVVEPVKRILHRDDLLLAEQRIAEFDAFGLTEDMERSIALFCDHFQLPLLAAPTRTNATREEEGDPRLEDARHLIAERNELDCALYDYAKALLKERYDAMLERYEVAASSLIEELAALRPRLLERFLASDSQPRATARTGHVDMANGLILSGFEPRFFYERLGLWLRWTTGEDGVIYLPLGCGGPLVLSVEIPYVADDPTGADLAFFVGGHRLEANLRYARFADGKDHLVADIVLPGELRNEPYTPVAIRKPDRKGASQASDSRNVCLARIDVAAGHAVDAQP